MIKEIRLLAAIALLAGMGASQAQVATPALRNVVQLSASGVVEVPQDWLTITLHAVVNGAQAPSVQSQLKTALDAALAEVHKMAQPGQMEVRTGAFSLSPRYDRDGKPTGWQGRTELVLQGRDFVRISTAAGQVTSLTVAQVSFSLSREQRTLVEREAQRLAIESFKAQAGDIARSFDLSRYTLREVSVMAQDQGFEGRPRMVSLSAKSAMADSPVPVEAGTTSVMVTVSGSVQLE